MRACSTEGCGLYTAVSLTVALRELESPTALSVQNTFTLGSLYAAAWDTSGSRAYQIQGDLDYTLVWPARTGPLAYSLEKSSSGGTWSREAVIDAAAGTSTFEQKVSAAAASSISYRVLSCADAQCLNTSPSNETLTVTLYDLRKVPISITSSDEMATLLNGVYTSRDGAYDIDWTGVSGAAVHYYELQRKQIEGSWEDVVFRTAVGRAESNIERGVYSYQMRVCAAADVCGLWSDSLAVDVRIFSGGGEGTAGSPYLIHNYEELKQVHEDLDAHYALANDIDAQASWSEGSDSDCDSYDGTAAFSAANPCSGWTPIGGDLSSPFSGSLDGQGNAVSKLYTNRPLKYAGLFGYTAGGSAVINTHLTDVYISGRVAGAAAGQNLGSIINSSAAGFVNGKGRTGGLAGTSSGEIKNSFAKIMVVGTGNAGGLVGYAGVNGLILNSYAEGSVEVTEGGNVGGAVGDNYGKIINSYAAAFVFVGDENRFSFGTGGLIGYNRERGLIQNSFSFGEVKGEGGGVGGLTGGNIGTIRNAYSAGWLVKSESANAGGLIGFNYNGTIHNSYARGLIEGRDNKSTGGLAGYSSEAGFKGSNYFVDISGGADGIAGDVSINGCASSAVCERRGSFDIGRLGEGGANIPADWNDSDWSYGEPDRLPALRYTQNPNRSPEANAADRWCDDAGDDDPDMPDCGTLIGEQPFLAPFASGRGSEGDPFVVRNYDQLHNVRHYLEDDFILGNHVEAVSSCNADSDGNCRGEGWEPIGSGAYRDPQITFTGVFDGQGYVISNLYINRPNRIGAALFAFAGNKEASGRAMEIRNLGLEDVNIRGGMSVAGLAGWNGGGTISRSYVTGRVAGGLFSYGYDTGGLVAWNEGGTILDCYTDVEVTGESFVGGLVGDEGGTIENSYALGNVTASSSPVGGLAGRGYGIISNSHAAGNVSGAGHVGGLVGLLTDEGSGNDGIGIVSNSYAAGNVSGSRASVGGLAGSISGGTISSSYAEGTVSGTAGAGGLAGTVNGGTISNSYYTKGTVTGSSFIGGLTGALLADGGVIANSYVSIDTVTGTGNHIGGLVGSNAFNPTPGGGRGIISNSYASIGTLTGVASVGGLVGRNNGRGRITNSYASIGTITGTGSSIGGLVGLNGSVIGSGMISNSYAAAATVTAGTFVGGLIGTLIGRPAALFGQLYFSNTGGTSGVGELRDGGESCGASVCVQALGADEAARLVWLRDTLDESAFPTDTANDPPQHTPWSADNWSGLGEAGFPRLKYIDNPNRDAVENAFNRWCDAPSDTGTLQMPDCGDVIAGQ